MNCLEQRYMETVPPALRKIAAHLEASRPRLVRIQKHGENTVFVNPATVSVVNAHDGEVMLGLTNSVSVATDFKTAEEAIKALGLGD